ncbi:MAG: hypothetical protein WBC91_11825, partial [Phototrophicaceae bacterium]
MDFFRKLFGSSNKKKAEPKPPRPKFVPPPLPEPPLNGIVTMDYVRQMLDEIRLHPQHSHRPRWAYVFDYFFEDATLDECQELIETVSNDTILCKRSPHIWRQEVINRHEIEPVVYLRRSFVSIILDNGHGQPTPCELPRTIDRERNFAKRKHIEDELEVILQKLSKMATPRITQILLTGVVNVGLFKDTGIEHCDDIRPEYFEKIQDETIKMLFEPLRMAYLKT